MANRRGIIRRNVKLTRVNAKSYNMIDEVDVTIYSHSEGLVVYAGTQSLGTFKNRAAADETVDNFIEKQKARGWKVINEREFKQKHRHRE